MSDMATKTSNLWKCLLVVLCSGEYFELVAFASLTPTIGKLFFSQSSPLMQQVNAIALFSLAYFIRPIGGYLVGKYSDTYGRKNALLLISLYGALFSFLIGCLPSGTTFGTLLLISLRCAQGFTLSNDSVLTAIWLNENSSKPGFWTALLIGVLALATLTAHLLIDSLQFYINPTSFLSWGWRIPFFLSATLVLLSWTLRQSLPKDQPLPQSNTDLTTLTLFTGFVMTATFGFLVLNYLYMSLWLPELDQNTLRMGWVTAFFVSLLVGHMKIRSPTVFSIFLMLCLLVIWIMPYHRYACIFYQIGLTPFVIMCYNWIIHHIPSHKRGQIFGLFTNLGISLAAACLPLLSSISRQNAFHFSLQIAFVLLSILLTLRAISYCKKSQQLPASLFS